MTAMRWGLILTVLVAAAIGVAFWLQPPAPRPSAPTVVATPPEVPPPAPPPDFPVPDAAPDATAIPALDESDAAFVDALLAVPGWRNG